MDRQVVGVSRFVYLSLYLSISLSLSLSLSIFVYLSLSIYLSSSSKTKLFCETFSCFKVDNIKMKQFSKTSSIFALDTIKKENVHLSAHMIVSYNLLHFSTPLVIICLKTIVPATKKWCLYSVHLSAAAVMQNHLSKPYDRMLQNVTPLRISLRNIQEQLWRTCFLCYLVLGLLRKKMHFCRFS